jgi:hypothetical protein
MQVSAVHNQINFNSKFPKPKNKVHIKVSGDDAENQALTELYKYWKSTGDFRAATIDFYNNGTAKVTLLGKPKQNIQKGQPNLFSKILNKITNIFKKK